MVRRHHNLFKMALMTSIAATLLSLPAFGKTGGPAMAAVEPGSGPATATQTGCFEKGSDDGSLSVTECLTQTSAAHRPAAAAPAVPDAIFQTLSAELQWMPQLMPRWNQPGHLSGVYTRSAVVESGKTFDMGSHAFDLKIEVAAELAAFTLQVEDHRVHRVTGEFDAQGNGLIDLTYNDASQRSLRYEAGAVADDTGAVESDKSSSFYMGCYIDTPAYDTFTANSCWRLFGSQPTVAVFKVFLPYTPQSVVWFGQVSGCSGIWCTAPISPNQSVSAYAYWVINGTPTGTVGATATYDGGL